jgi:hypothetical protein
MMLHARWHPPPRTPCVLKARHAPVSGLISLPASGAKSHGVLRQMFLNGSGDVRVYFTVLVIETWPKARHWGPYFLVHPWTAVEISNRLARLVEGDESAIAWMNYTAGGDARRALRYQAMSRSIPIRRVGVYVR